VDLGILLGHVVTGYDRHQPNVDAFRLEPVNNGAADSGRVNEDRRGFSDVLLYPVADLGNALDDLRIGGAEVRPLDVPDTVRVFFSLFVDDYFLIRLKRLNRLASFSVDRGQFS